MSEAGPMRVPRAPEGWIPYSHRLSLAAVLWAGCVAAGGWVGIFIGLVFPGLALAGIWTERSQWR